MLTWCKIFTYASSFIIKKLTNIFSSIFYKKIVKDYNKNFINLYYLAIKIILFLIEYYPQIHLHIYGHLVLNKLLILSLLT